MKKQLPLLLLILFSIIFFYKFFFSRLIPIPSDIIVGLYHPWIDQKWGGLTTSVPVKNPLMSDIVSIIYQWRTEAITQIKTGHFPFWQTRFFSGLPLFANFQSSVINLTNLAFFLPFSSATNWGWMIYLNLLVSLLFSYLFFKNLFQKVLPAIVSALSFSLSVFSVTWLEYGLHSYVAAFLPLILYSLDQKKYLLLSLSIALQIYGGYPQYSIFTFIFAAIYYLVRYRFQHFFPVAISSIVGLILALPLLLPGLELTRLSLHDTDQTSLASNNGFLPPQNILTFICPNFWGNPTTRDYTGIGFYDNNAIYPSLLAVIGFFAFTKTNLSFLNFFTVIFCFIVATPNPVSFFLQKYLGFIFPKQGISTRVFLLANFAFAYFAGQTFLHPKHLKKSLLIVFTWIISLILFSFFNSNSIGLKNTLYCFVFFIVTALFLLTKHYSLCLLALFLELFYYGHKYLPFTPPSYLFPHTAITDFLKNTSSAYRVATFDTIPPNMWQPYHLQTVDGYDTLAPLTSFQYAYFLNHHQLPTSTARAITLNHFSQPLISDASIKYILKVSSSPSSLPTEFSPSQYRLAFWDKNIAIVENQTVLPRARLTNQVIVVHDLQSTAKQLLNYQLGQAIIVTNTFDPNPITNCLSSSDTTNIIQDDPNQISINTNSTCPRLLVLADTFYPGWQATIDQKPTPIFQTNLNFRSVSVSAGQHQIVFSYQPFHL